MINGKKSTIAKYLKEIAIEKKRRKSLMFFLRKYFKPNKTKKRPKISY
jgi:hypothetical protein